ncbi:hypothetical protein DSD19_05445 [Rhodovulum sp. BSW8]|nr:hypothetical protein DSD19_05445 [Rhodovulum sp. BSW8]
MLQNRVVALGLGIIMPHQSQGRGLFFIFARLRQDREQYTCPELQAKNDPPQCGHVRGRRLLSLSRRSAVWHRSQQ